MTDYGTDIGPPCPDCRGTIYRYRPIAKTTLIAVWCSGCHRETTIAAPTHAPYSQTDDRPPTAAELRRWHRETATC